MFRNRKISFIVGAGVGAVTLLLACLLAGEALTGTGFVKAMWVLLLVSAIIALAAGVVGAFVIMQDKFAKIQNLYGLVYTCVLCLPALMMFLCLVADGITVLDQLSRNEPDAFANSVLILSGAIPYITLIIGIALPIAGHYKKMPT